jgi:hypothetical protein
MTDNVMTRREMMRRAAAVAAAAAFPGVLSACVGESDAGNGDEAAGSAAADTSGRYPAASAEDRERLIEWVRVLRLEGLADASVPLGQSAVRVGELAIGTPYEPFTLEAYLKAGGSPMRTEPLTLHLDRFDCVSLVEACLAVSRVARSDSEVAASDAVSDADAWNAFAREMERMRYRGGVREGYVSRLHYFSDWLGDHETRGMARIMGRDLGAEPDTRPLRFMSSHPDAYPALAYPEVLEDIAAMERRLDARPRWVVPTAEIAGISDQIDTGDILAFATSIEGLDVTHAAFAYRDESGVLRVLHAPLSGGVVEITETTVPEYVAAIGRSTGVLIARPRDGVAAT